jgi:hypothetical protein
MYRAAAKPPRREVVLTRTARYLAVLFSLVGVLTAQMALPRMPDDRALAQSSSAAQPQSQPATIGLEEPDPEDGSVSSASYFNPYFGLSVPLPPGWSEGLAGPPPSNLGTYVLTALDGTTVDAATMLIVAQDLFFSAKPFANAAAMAADFRKAIAAMPDMTIDNGPAGTTVANETMLRLDYHAGGLFRVWLAAERRCHVVTFNITGTDRGRIDDIVRGLDKMTLPADPTRAVGASVPGHATHICIKDYVTPQTLLRKVEPIFPIDSGGLNVPVRIIIGIDGRVRHVHVISAGAAQRRAITEALVQWEFTPHDVLGHPSEVETGLVFKLKSHGP